MIKLTVKLNFNVSKHCYEFKTIFEMLIEVYS